MRTTLLCLALLAAVLPGVAADDPADRLPASALLYAELTDLTNLFDKVVQLPVWRDKQLIAKSKDELLKMLEQQLTKELKLDWAAVTRIAGQARKLTFCLTDVHLRSEMPVMTVVLDLTSTEEARKVVTGPLAKMFGKTEKLAEKTVYVAEPDRNVQLFLYLGKTRAVLTLDRRSMQRFLGSGSVSDPLSGLAAFKEMRERYGKRLLWAFGNVNRGLDVLTDAFSRRERLDFDKVDSVFDFRGLKYVGLGSAPETDVTGQATEATVVLAAEHAIYKVARTPKLDKGLLGWVPGDSTAFVLGAHVGDPVKTWAEVVKIGKQLEKAFSDDDFSRFLEEFKNRAGLSVSDALAAFEPSALLTAPIIDGRIARGPAFVAQIKDPASFGKLIEKLKKSRLFGRVADKIKQTTYRQARIEYVDRGRPGRGDMGYALLGKTVIFSADWRVLKSYVDAHADGKSLAARYGLAGKLDAYHKLFCVDPLWMADQESEFSFLRHYAKEGVPLVIGTMEENSRLRLGANVSAFSFAAGLGLSLYRWESTRRVASQCQTNLRKVGKALSAHLKEHKKYPAQLADLKLPKGTLVCPLDKGKETTQSYKYVPIRVKDVSRYYGLTAWCPHTEHGRVMLYASGYYSSYPWRTSESRFRRYKARMEEELKRAKGEAAAAKEKKKEEK